MRALGIVLAGLVGVTLAVLAAGMTIEYALGMWLRALLKVVGT